MFPGEPQALVATAFIRHFADETNARNLFQRRQEILNDITDTVGSTVLGLTYGCARCHDHKFDPILHTDYYRLQAFFAGVKIEENAALAPASMQQAHSAKLAIWEEKTQAIRAEMAALVKPAIDAKALDNFEKFPQEIQDAIRMDPAKRTPMQWQMAYKAHPYMHFPEAEIARSLKGDKRKRYDELDRQLQEFAHLKPADLPRGQVMVESTDSAPPETYLLRGGAWDGKEQLVAPGFLAILDPKDATITPLNGRTGRRAALARWLTSPGNPLTARVMVNRVWHYHFGRGLVGTPSDFGMMGERPSNRALLDDLAARFMRNGWSIKALHREILLSAAYQQSSAANAKALEVDPENKLVWRFSRRRLEGEAIRDSILHTAGLLNEKMHGPGVFPPLPAGVVTRGGWKKNEDPAEAHRRSIYIFVRRNTRYPMLESFDMPDTHESCARRSATVTPSQALELMNNDLVFEWAQALSTRVANDTGMDEDARIDRAYRLVYSRPASPAEKQSASQFLARQQTLGSKQPLADLCHVLLQSNEFLYVN
jgi:hypothetical protein